MADLRPQMRRHEVDEVIARHGANRLQRTATPEEVLLRGQTGVASSWQLAISFRADRLVRARARTEDGPFSRPSDVPPDIDVLGRAQ
jgi:hypothetical protein